MTAASSIDGLRFGPIGAGAVHVAIDMQVVFADHADWGAASTHEILPQIARIAGHRPGRTLFTRFLPPKSLPDLPGQWRAFYRRWPQMLAKNGNTALFDLLPVLKRFVPPAKVVDKLVYSAFEAPGFEPALRELAADTLILTGVETDVCVLATAIAAIDRGYRTILISDALASGSDAGHAAALASVYPRFDQQIELIDTETLLREWKKP
ncbi:MAG: cysteine hydrolase family protein [Dongiaceae bacterium]